MEAMFSPDLLSFILEIKIYQEIKVIKPRTIILWISKNTVKFVHVPFDFISL